MLMQRAISQRWLTDEQKPKAMAAVASCLESPDDRVRLRAVEILAQMERQNQADEHKVIDVSIQLDHARLSQVASELGIDASIISGGKIEAGSNTGSTVDNEAD